MSRKVLVIDDDALVCESVEEALRKQGYTPITATSGAEGIDAYRSNPGY